MEKRVERIIHPAGFGAFCTERFLYDGDPCFDVLYDCGTLTSGLRSNLLKEAQSYYSAPYNIDLVCVSHFDNDHIDVLQELISHQIGVKKGETRFMLPFLSDIFHVFEPSNTSVGNYYRLQQQLRGDGYSVIYVPPYNLDDRTDNDSMNIDEHEGKDVNLKVGASVTANDIAEIWKYTPLYLQDDSVIRDFLTKIVGSGFIPEDKKYHYQHDILTKEEIEKLKEAYKTCGTSVPSKNTPININSMLLLSEPVAPNKFVAIGDCCGAICPCGLIQASCLYTGDAGFTAFPSKWSQLQKQYFPQGVGLLQIPHHGTQYYYDYSVLSHLKFAQAFVQTQLESNNPKHPVFFSQVETDIRHKLHKCLHVVTEDPASIFKQRIYLQ